MSHQFQDVAALLARVADDHKAPSVAAAAVVDGQIAHVATQGYRDLERRLPMTADTPSRWYSISKPLTGLAFAQLVHQGKLRWDQPVAQLVPGLRFADAVATERATIADCLLHRTGLPSGDWTWFGAPSDPAELLRRLPHVACTPGFRAGHHYQNLHFTILGEVFRAAGTDWHQALRDLLVSLGVQPLTRLSEFVAADRALGYGPNGFTPPFPVADFDFEAIAPRPARSADRLPTWRAWRARWPKPAKASCRAKRGPRQPNPFSPYRPVVRRSCSCRPWPMPGAWLCTGASWRFTGRADSAGMVRTSWRCRAGVWRPAG